MADYVLLRKSGYYFRYIIPERYWHLSPVKELRYSLSTHELSVAKRRARNALVSVDTLLTDSRKKPPSQGQQ